MRALMPLNLPGGLMTKLLEINAQRLFEFVETGGNEIPVSKGC